MGEARGMLPGMTFNRSVKVECRPERLSSEGGALVIREVLEKTGVARRLAKELPIRAHRTRSRIRFSSSW